VTDELQIVRPSPGTVARVGFGEQSLEHRSTAAIATAERARAEIQAMHAMALQRPRDLHGFRVRILDHCKRLRFAMAARYRKPIGRKEINGRWVEQFIEGASIRFVETALASYGNVLSEGSITFEDDEQVQVRVTVRDLESTIAYADEAIIRKTVERRTLRKGQKAISQRTNSYGDTVYIVEATDDEVANQKAARQSKLLRNLGLRILPADVVEEAIDLCKTTVEAGVAKDPGGEQKKLSDAFHALGVSPAQLAEYLGHPLEQTQPAELVELREVYQTMRDGEGTWRDALAARQPARVEPEAAAPTARGAAGVKQQLAQRARKRAEPTAELDEVEQEVAAISASIADLPANPQWVPGLRERIARLPLADRGRLEVVMDEAEKQLAAARGQDDLPVARAERLAKEDAAAEKDPRDA
jgi:hypothetical protein